MWPFKNSNTAWKPKTWNSEIEQYQILYIYYPSLESRVWYDSEDYLEKLPNWNIHFRQSSNLNWTVLSTGGNFSMSIKLSGRSCANLLWLLNLSTAHLKLCPFLDDKTAGCCGSLQTACQISFSYRCFLYPITTYINSWIWYSSFRAPFHGLFISLLTPLCCCRQANVVDAYLLMLQVYSCRVRSLT